jgi:hypothetical protein
MNAYINNLRFHYSFLTLAILLFFLDFQYILIVSSHTSYPFILIIFTFTAILIIFTFAFCILIHESIVYLFKFSSHIQSCIQILYYLSSFSVLKPNELSSSTCDTMDISLISYYDHCDNLSKEEHHNKPPTWLLMQFTDILCN